MGGGGSASRTLSVTKKPWARRAVLGAATAACVALPFLAIGTTTPATFTTASPVGASPATADGASSARVARLPDLTPWAVPPGGRLVVSAAGFAPDGTVTVRLLSHPIGASKHLRAGANGTVRTVVAVPGGDRAGWDTLTIEGPARRGGTLQQQAAVQVLHRRA